MSAQARIAHHIDGRVRLEIPAHRGDAAYFERLSAHMRQAGHVRRARSNHVASSITLDYAGTLAQVVADLAQAAVEIGPPPAPARLPAGVPDPMYLAALVFGTVGVIQAARGDIMLPALSAFWYAASALRAARSAAPPGSPRRRHAPPA